LIAGRHASAGKTSQADVECGRKYAFVASDACGPSHVAARDVHSPHLKSPHVSSRRP
jgi:hypothetical protein